MRSRQCCLAYLVGIVFQLGTLPAYSADARVYYQGTYYQGPYVDLEVGQVVERPSDGDEFCVDILSPNTAVIVESLSPQYNAPYNENPPFYPLIYVDKDFPEVFGTDQYEDALLRISCVPAATNWRQLPQPDVYVPFDFSSRNTTPDPANDTPPIEAIPGHRQLVLRRAYFWENSEDVGGWHGPYADIKIGAYRQSVVQYSDMELVQNSSLWDSPSLIIQKTELPGPVWGGYATIGYPDPYDEWIDGPFGCVYSNISVMDWGVYPDESARIGIIISESDSPDAYMGRSASAIGPSDEGEILIKVWGFGFVVVENIWVPEGGERNLATGDVYWYGGWDGEYPCRVYGPTNPAVPYENSYGSQFKPFTDSMFNQFREDPSFFGYEVGLLKGGYPILTFENPHSYYHPNTEGSVRFGN